MCRPHDFLIIVVTLCVKIVVSFPHNLSDTSNDREQDGKGKSREPRTKGAEDRFKEICIEDVDSMAMG